MIQTARSAAAALALVVAAQFSLAEQIDRHALVARHNVVLTSFDARRPLSVGNGEFAFNMDITGLQTFAAFNTMSHWGWHSGSPPAGTSPSDYQLQPVQTGGRMVPYPLHDPAHPQISQWLAASPHRINLGRLGLDLKLSNGSPAAERDLEQPRQALDLWHGVVTSSFSIEGSPVRVRTACHPSLDAVAVSIESPLVREGRVGVYLAVPGNNPLQFADYVGDWANPAKLDILDESGSNRLDLRRVLDEHTTYYSLCWNAGASVRKAPAEPSALRIIRAEYGSGTQVVDVTALVAAAVKDHRLVIRAGNHLAGDPAPKVVKSLRVQYAVGDSQREATAPENGEIILDAAPERRRITVASDGASGRLDVVCVFSPQPATHAPTAAEVFAAAEQHWPQYWSRGGAIDLSQSTDPRWKELERRIVLSQYLMAVHEAGTLPPQESGLVNNGWFGRFHMEMVWWHAAHWGLWGREPELRKVFDAYERILPAAASLASTQGYKGARWPKCLGPTDTEWPHEIHSFLAWQQPHPIYFAELEYRAHPTAQTLERWRPIVEATADFMASYAQLNPGSGAYDLGPPIHLASENTKPLTTRNPTFELGYWRFGLRTACLWQERLGLPPKPEWKRVLEKLAPLPVEDGCYILHEGVTDMWTKWNFEHPALTGTYGMLPGDGVDTATMRRTLDRVVETWNFANTWGWDYPMLAMCAARLGEPERALEFLLHSSPQFEFDEAGLATGGPYPYFPSNGGLLYAAAMMAAGWDGSGDRPAPGFPADGSWTVRAEGISPAP